MPTPSIRHAATALLMAMTSGAVAPGAMAQTALPPCDVPARSLPMHGDVSPEAQALIALLLRQDRDRPPSTPEGWRALANARRPPWRRTCRG